MAILHKSKTITFILTRHLRNLTCTLKQTLDVLNLQVRTQKKDKSHNYHIGHIMVALFAAELHDTLQPLINVYILQMFGQKHGICTA